MLSCMKKTCACGCGTPVKATWARGHYTRPGGTVPRWSVSDTRVCEECGREYHRGELKSPQSNRHWATRRFCGEPCRRAWTSRWAASRKGEARKADATHQAGRKRARVMYGKHDCSICGAQGEIHHKDGDPLNNDPSNIAFLCRKHHIAAEDRNSYKRKAATPEERREQIRAYQRAWYERNRERVLAANREKYRRRKESGG